MTRGGAVSQTTSRICAPPGLPSCSSCGSPSGGGPTRTSTMSRTASFSTTRRPGSRPWASSPSRCRATHRLSTPRAIRPWSERVQAPPVTISRPPEPDHLPRQLWLCLRPGAPEQCRQHLHGERGQRSSGTPAGTTYGSTNRSWPTGRAPSPATCCSEPTTCQSPSPASPSTSVGAVTKLSSRPIPCYPGYDQGSHVNLSYPSSSRSRTACPVPAPGRSPASPPARTVPEPSSPGQQLRPGRRSASLPADVTRIASVACPSVGVHRRRVRHGRRGEHRGDRRRHPRRSLATAPPASALTGSRCRRSTCPSATTCVAIGTTATGRGSGPDRHDFGTVGRFWTAATSRQRHRPDQSWCALRLAPAVWPSEPPARPAPGHRVGISGAGTWAAWTTPTIAERPVHRRAPTQDRLYLGLSDDVHGHRNGKDQWRC